MVEHVWNLGFQGLTTSWMFVLITFASRVIRLQQAPDPIQPEELAQISANGDEAGFSYD
jgi:hypothetical protein